MNKYWIPAIALCLLADATFNLPHAVAQTAKPEPKAASAQTRTQDVIYKGPRNDIEALAKQLSPITYVNCNF